MVSKYLVYCLVDPRFNEVRYIGKSSYGLSRPESHGAPAKLANDRTYKARWIRELQRNGLTYAVEVLEYVQEPSELCAAERYWIMAARANGWRLTNLTDGGEGLSGLKFSAEHRARISAANKGQQLTPEQRARFMQHVRTRDNSIYVAHAKKMYEARRGTHHSTETKAKIGAGNRGKVVSAEGRANIALAKGHPVRELTTGAVYPSATAAARALSLEPSGVHYAVSGKFKQFHGYRFERVQ